MNLSKSKILPLTGMAILILFIVMSWLNESIFLDRILVCSFILFAIFIVNIRNVAQRPQENGTVEH
jgi:hypothetical protein